MVLPFAACDNFFVVINRQHSRVIWKAEFRVVRLSAIFRSAQTRETRLEESRHSNGLAHWTERSIILFFKLIFQFSIFNFFLFCFFFFLNISRKLRCARLPKSLRGVSATTISVWRAREQPAATRATAAGTRSLAYFSTVRTVFTLRLSGRLGRSASPAALSRSPFIPPALSPRSFSPPRLRIRSPRLPLPDLSGRLTSSDFFSLSQSSLLLSFANSSTTRNLSKPHRPTVTIHVLSPLLLLFSYLCL